MKCTWNKSWVGPCGSDVPSFSRFCPDHEDRKCGGCGRITVGECEETGIQFVCGVPLCPNCEHGPRDPSNPGLFNLGGGHRPKSAPAS